jgi:LacI family transcriptional regulator
LAAPTLTVGIVVPDILDPFFGPIIRGVEHVLSEHSYLAVLANVDREEGREPAIAETLLSRHVDGIMLVSGAWPEDLISRVVDEGVPMVTLHRRANDPRVSSVMHDEGEGTRLILEHLASLGHRCIGHIAGPQDFASGANRYRAFDLYRKRLGLDGSRTLVAFAENYEEASGERCAETLLERRGLTAITCANDRLAIGAISALQRRGFDCPRDISVCGYNDMMFADRVVPALTTVRTDLHRQGTEAAAIMIEMMGREHTPPPRHVVLPVELVVRNSTGPVRGSDVSR